MHGLGRCCRRLRLVHHTAPQQRLDAGRKLQCRERLYQIVIPTVGKPLGLIHIAGLGGQEQNRHHGLGAYLAAKLNAGQPRHHHIQNHKVGQRVKPAQRLLGIGSFPHGEALPRQQDMHDFPNIVIIVHNQNIRALCGKLCHEMYPLILVKICSQYNAESTKRQRVQF